MAVVPFTEGSGTPVSAPDPEGPFVWYDTDEDPPVQYAWFNDQWHGGLGMADFAARVQILEPVAYWPMQEASGTTCTDVVGSVVATVAGTGITIGDSDGPWTGQKSVVLTGSGDLASSLSVDASPDLTLMAAFKSTATGSRGLIGQRNSPAKGVEIGIGTTAIHGGNGRPHIFQDANSLDEGVEGFSAWNDGVWHLLIGLVDGTNGVGYGQSGYRIYLDGELLDGQFNQFFSASPPLDLGAVHLGSWGATSHGPFSGRMCHAAVWDRALNKQEIKDLGTLFYKLRDA